MICAILGVWFNALTLCFKLESFFYINRYKDDATNVTILNFLYSKVGMSTMRTCTDSKIVVNEVFTVTLTAYTIKLDTEIC